jgi:hypothetical protein
MVAVVLLAVNLTCNTPLTLAYTGATGRTPPTGLSLSSRANRRGITLAGNCLARVAPKTLENKVEMLTKYLLRT